MEWSPLDHFKEAAHGSRLLDQMEVSARLAMQIARPLKAFDLHHPLPSGPIIPRPLDSPRRSRWMMGLLFQMVALRLPGLRSHSRPEEVGLARQNRMRCRPRENFAGPTGLRPEKQEYFMLTPTDPKRTRSPGRGETTSKARLQMKQSRSAKQLLSAFRRFIAEGMVDASVVSAAVQRCGHGRWWDALLEVMELQEKSSVVSDDIHHNLLLNAIGSCLTGHNCTDHERDARKATTLQMGKRVWGQCSPPTPSSFNCQLSSVLKLCLRIGSKNAFAWADELWCLSEEEAFEKNIISYTAWLSLLERQGRHGDVDHLLHQLGGYSKTNIKLDEVVLGDLISCATRSRDAKRADKIWQILVGRYKVKPSFLAYTTYAQAHLLAGYPQNTLRIIDAMIPKQRGPADFRHSMDYKLALLYLQTLLIVYHSSMSLADGARLQAFLPKGAAIVEKKSAKGAKAEWKALEAMGQKLLASDHKPSFKELLIKTHARDSLMKTWKNHRAGANYLPEANLKI